MNDYILGYHNLDFTRTVEEQFVDIQYVCVRSHLSVFVECKKAFGRRSTVAQPSRLREAIVANGTFLRRKGSVESSRRRFGKRIGRRRFVWGVPDWPGLPRTAVIAAHMPPKRYWGVLYAAYVVTLVALVARHRAMGRQVIVVGDWNKLVKRDPAGLRRRWGGRLYGTRIDGAWMTRGIAKHVVDYREEPRPNRTDGHPACFWTFRGK